MAVGKSLTPFLAFLLLVSYSNGQFTDAQKKELTDKHNNGRRLQNAADMNEVAWHDGLASEGQKLAETCKDGHVAVTVAGITTVGQNLYYKQGVSNPVNSYDAWYGEIQSYDTKTNKCNAGAVCGHYRMVVLNTITKIGCGVKVCSSFTKEGGNKISDVTYVVCHYDDAPIGTGPVFTVGSPCTKCLSGKFWCNNNLCQPTCSAASATCQCYAKYKGVCMNCGTANEADCTCKCADGYLGTYCTEQCKDLPTGTDMKTSCTEDVVDDAEYYCVGDGGKCCPYIKERTCRATCAPYSKFCKPLTAALEKAATTDCKETPPEPPVNPATTTASPSGATTTTTPAPGPDACKDYKCINGKKLAEGAGCKCSCFENWQGTACDVAGTTVAGATTRASDTTVAGASTKASDTTKVPETTTPAVCKDYSGKCVNGAKVAVGNKCECKCNANWLGVSCEEAIKGATTTAATISKTTTTTTAATGTTRDPCLGHKCYNGKMNVQNNICTCTCDASWQGTTCDESVEEAQNGILLTMSFKQEQWTSVEEGLKKAIPKAISKYCNKNFGACCPGMGARKNPSTTYDISSVAFANVGKGYPQYLQTDVTILLYVKYDSNNQLCQDGAGATSGRRKRAAAAYLPQDVLFNSVEADKAAINADMQTCCNTDVQTIEKSKVKPSAGGNSSTPGCDTTKKGLKDWEIALIVLGVLLAIFFLILLIYFLVRSGACHKSQKETLHTQLAESQGQNKVSPHCHDPHYQGEVAIAPSPQPSYDIYDNKTQYQVYM